ncbi:hypothetical protein WMY93_013085 [Mugilogobius chulae]|uniref:Methyltransferase domain-containing protein n=1 Tax=Mugilogobius chulae TaxID=88201 RepID=A0AAW0P2H1_9GOBI
MVQKVKRLDTDQWRAAKLNLSSEQAVLHQITIQWPDSFDSHVSAASASACSLSPASRPHRLILPQPELMLRAIAVKATQSRRQLTTSVRVREKWKKSDVGLHACGVATDMVMEHCIQARAAFVISPCCYGFIQNANKFSFPRRFVLSSNQHSTV